MDKSAEVIVPKKTRTKKPPQPVKVRRSAGEWKQMIEEAKRKETYWTKGIVPGKGEFVGTGEEVESY